jgi:hypothetical protein
MYSYAALIVCLQPYFSHKINPEYCHMKTLHPTLWALLCFLCLALGCREKHQYQISEAERVRILGDSLFQAGFTSKDTLSPMDWGNLRLFQIRKIAFAAKELNWNERIVDKMQLMRYVALTKYKVVPLYVFGQKMYRCENDILRSEDNVHNFIYQRLKMAWEDSLQNRQKDRDIDKLVVFEDAETHKIVRWDESKKIRYCVDDSFNEAEKEQVIKAMRSANADWAAQTSADCPKFSEIAYLHHKSQAELSRNYPGKVDFVVTKGTPSEKDFYASAFFPDENRFENRVLVIGVSFFEKPDSFQIGVCRHEMGHILGLLHENIYNAKCSREIPPGKPRHYICNGEQVDIYSVMHYLCGKKRTEIMTISSCDIEGINHFYALEQPNNLSPKHTEQDDKPVPKTPPPGINTDPVLLRKR